MVRNQGYLIGGPYDKASLSACGSIVGAPYFRKLAIPN